MAPRKPRKPATPPTPPPPPASKFYQTDPDDPEAPRVLAEYVTNPSGHLIKPGDVVNYANPAMPGLGNPTPGDGPMTVAELVLFPDPERPYVEAVLDGGAYQCSADNLRPVEAELTGGDDPALANVLADPRLSDLAVEAEAEADAAGQRASLAPPSPAAYITRAAAEHERIGRATAAHAALIGAEADAREDRVFAAQLADALGAPLPEVDRVMRAAAEAGLAPLDSPGGTPPTRQPAEVPPGATPFMRWATEEGRRRTMPATALATRLRQMAAQLDTEAEEGRPALLGASGPAVLRMAALAVEPTLSVSVEADTGRLGIQLAGTIEAIEAARREELEGEWPDLSQCTAQAFAAYEAIQAGQFDPYLPILGGAIHARRVKMAAEAIEIVRNAGGDPDDPDDPAWGLVARSWRPRPRRLQLLQEIRAAPGQVTGGRSRSGYLRRRRAASAGICSATASSADSGSRVGSPSSAGSRVGAPGSSPGRPRTSAGGVHPRPSVVTVYHLTSPAGPRPMQVTCPPSCHSPGGGVVMCIGCPSTWGRVSPPR